MKTIRIYCITLLLCPLLVSISTTASATKEMELNNILLHLDNLPKGLTLLGDLNILASPALQGQLIYNQSNFIDCPRATVTPNGDLLLMFPAGDHYTRSQEKNNDMLAFRSSDNGKTWDGPKVAFDIPYSQHGFIPLIPKDSKRIYCFGTQPIKGIREGSENAPIGFRYSDDDGHTWSDTTLIAPTNDPDFKGMSCMRMCETDNGTWLLGSHASFWDVRPLKTRQYVLRSEDQGKTWTVGPKPQPDGWYVEGFNRMDEGRPISLDAGKVLFMARTPEGHLWTTRSEDDGKTWSASKPSPLVHPDAPPMLFHLSDGKTLAAFHHNRHFDNYKTLSSNDVGMMKDRQEVWVSFSTDEGHTWSEPRFVYANANTKQLANPWLTYNASYMDMVIKDGVCHLFFPHRWSRITHLQLKEKDLFTLPTQSDLETMLNYLTIPP